MEPRIVIDVILKYNLIINNNCTQTQENLIFYGRGTTRIMEKVNYSSLQQKQKGRTDAPQNKCGQSCRPCCNTRICCDTNEQMVIFYMKRKSCYGKVQLGFYSR